MKSSLWPRLLVALVVAGMMASALPGGAPARMLATPPAGATTITFDDLPITGEPGGLPVSDWYRDQGVLFNNAIAENYGHLAGFSHSGFTGIHQCESSQINACNTPLIMTFAEPQWYVGLWLGFADSLPVPAQVTMTAYNAEIAGDVVDEDSVWIGPSEGGFIPVNTELEVGAPEGGPPDTLIRRVEVGFVDDNDLTADLIFDNVAFAHGGRGGFHRPTCPAGTTPPTVVLRQPVSGKTTKANSFDLNSSVTPRDTLTEATLTAESDRGETRTRSIFDTVFTPGDPNFGKATITNLLFPGVNRVTLDVFNCAGPGTASAAVEYRPSASNTRYTMLGLEVTQAIQDLDNSVPLVAGKRTFVRVYLATTGSNDIFTDVTAYLTGCRVASESAATCDGPLERTHSRNAITVDSLATPPDLKAKRQKMRSALLFELPPQWWREGLLRLALDGASLSPALPCDGCDNLTAAGAPRTYRFQPAEPLTVNIVSVGFTQGEIRYVPSAKDRQFLESWLRRAYPTSAVNSVWLVGEVNFPTRPSCVDVSVAMFHEWAIANATGGWEITPTRYFGLVPLLGAMDKSQRGCALIGTTDKAADAERPYNDHYASGPSGTGVNFTWDRDGSFADFYGAHEIAHTFGRLHPGWCDDSGDEDPNPAADDFRDGTIGGNDKKYMGFDAGDGRFKSLPRRLYRGDLWFDVMSYCDRIWISPYTYEALLPATPTPTPVETPTPPLEDSDVEIVFADGPDDGDVGTFATPVAGDDVGVPATPTAAQQMLLVLGTINLDDSTVDLKPFSVLPGNLETPRNANGSFSIVLRDGGHDELITYRFEPRQFEDEPAGTPQLAMLAEAVPWVDNTKYIDINRNDQRIAERTVRDNPPVVDITAPEGANRIQDGVIPVTWTGQAGDDDEMDLEPELTYSLLYSTDDGQTWRSVVAGLRDTHFDVDSSLLPGSDRARFRVIASDGVLTGEDQSDTFTIAPKPPEAGIIAPADGERFGRTETIVLVGTGSDLARGTLGDAAMTWSADDGTPEQRALGTGQSIAVNDLPPGRHTITLTARNDAGLSATATVNVRIIEDAPPVVDLGDQIPGSDGSPEADQGQHGLLLYDNADEAGSFYVNDSQGQWQPLRTFDVLLNGWSAIIPGNFGGDDFTDLLFYASDLGVGEFYASDGHGGLQLLSGNEGFTRGWDLIAPGNFGDKDGWTDLFFYDREEGIGKFYTTDGAGRIQLMSEVPLSHTWSAMAAGDFGGDEHSDLLFYDQASGLARFYATDGQGGLAPLGDDMTWTSGLDQIVSGAFGGEDVLSDLFLYDGETGSATFVSANGQGGVNPLGSATTTATTWTTIIGGNFGGDTGFSDLFFYDREAGQGTFYTTDGAGALTELRPMDGITAGWDLIVPGQFGSS